MPLFRAYPVSHALHKPELSQSAQFRSSTAQQCDWQALSTVELWSFEFVQKLQRPAHSVPVQTSVYEKGQKNAVYEFEHCRVASAAVQRRYALLPGGRKKKRRNFAENGARETNKRCQIVSQSHRPTAVLLVLAY